MSHNERFSPGGHYVNIRGIKLWYYVQGSGPVLLVQPGGAGWGGDASPYIETLKPFEKVRTVIYLEPRGIGRSQRLTDPHAYKMEEYVKDIESLRNYFGAPQIAIAGHSHGGFVALKYALQYPKMVESLLLIDTSPYIYFGDYHSWLSKRKGYREASSALKKLQNDVSLSDDEKERATLKILLPVIHFYDFDKVSTQVNNYLTNMVVSAKPHQYFNHYEAPKYDLRESIQQINAPTLIINGDDDMPHIVLGSKYLHDHLSLVNHVVIENCGHWPMIEAPDSFFRAAIPFLSQ
ncbi:MAG: alpha/beta hydrolase [Candidatus Heimdallarchaeota archaeon]|nr:MAG: alpha/beta hydrolase [Candidatus Heimdallarchaeota archaeon]